MSAAALGPSPQVPRYALASGQRQTPRVAPRAAGGLSPGWALVGLGVIALGVAGWIYLGPDLRRYLKIRHM